MLWRNILIVWGMAATLNAATVDAAPVDYVRQVKPLLRDHCYSCHGVLRIESGLRLDTAASMRRGGELGPAIVPGDPDASLLIQVVTGEAGFQMPPEEEGRPLSEAEIALLRRWIEEGAAAPADEQPAEDPREHWSYQAPRRPGLPAVPAAAADWVQTPIDTFVAARHAEFGLRPLDEARPDLLLRRVYLDLVGVPPTAEQRRAFLEDPSFDAYARVVEELLASPRYGERWGRHWMDIWRYSDWYGRRGSNEIRYSQRHIWRWRDWIIASVNGDKGYDRKLIEMLAGDEVAPTDPDVLAATGFLGRNWYKFDRNTWLFETVEKTGRGLLALPLRCARCHDHKFDPVSQEEYYRFRAFFEPHGVRVDPILPAAGTEIDNSKAQVLKDGLARVYDADLQAPTYRFVRGNDRRPDKSRALSPGVPASLSAGPLEIEPVALPVGAYYPALRPDFVEASLDAAQREIAAARDARRQTHQRVAELEAALESGSFERPAPSPAFLADDFAMLDPGVWQVTNGRWECRDGRLVQSEVASFRTLTTLAPHPADFMARVVYRTTEAGDTRSVGMSFDVHERNFQAIYTHVNDRGSAVHAFHRQNGRDIYPAAAVVPHPLELNETVTLDFAVRGELLNVWVDGQLTLAYRMPMARRAGRFALWVHRGNAEFDSVRIRPLPAEIPLSGETEPPRPSPLEPRTRADAEQEIAALKASLARRDLDVELAEAKRASLAARVAAERAQYGVSEPSAELARQASRAERALARLQADVDVREAKARLEALKATAEDMSQETVQARQKAEQAYQKALEKQTRAQRQLDEESHDFTPLGKPFPDTSSGRRLALARWLVDPRHPRTARVCVNHIWLRHFGQALVPSVDDLGPRAGDPSHPELLDWLALELIDNGWSMKHLHRLIVLSRTYRMTSRTDRVPPANQELDPANRYLWRMNSRRMEAEVVRDSMLALAGDLDWTIGGPDLDESQGERSGRRSLYFRTTPDNKMLMLELFDFANPNECYRRRESVIPQQALALTNSSLAMTQARRVARQLLAQTSGDAFIDAAFERILCRSPVAAERDACRRFLARQRGLLAEPGKLTRFSNANSTALPPADKPAVRACENLVQVLLNHNDFVTIR